MSFQLITLFPEKKTLNFDDAFMILVAGNPAAIENELMIWTSREKLDEFLAMSPELGTPVVKRLLLLMPGKYFVDARIEKPGVIEDEDVVGFIGEVH